MLKKLKWFILKLPIRRFFKKFCRYSSKVKRISSRTRSRGSFIRSDWVRLYCHFSKNDHLAVSFRKVHKKYQIFTLVGPLVVYQWSKCEKVRGILHEIRNILAKCKMTVKNWEFLMQFSVYPLYYFNFREKWTLTPTTDIFKEDPLGGLSLEI